MTLTALRRLVASGNVLAVLAAGGAGWYFADAEVAPRDRSEWRRLFPQQTDSDARLSTDTTLPWNRYDEAAGWHQGQKIVEKPLEADTAPKPPPIPPLKQRFKLKTVMVATGDDVLASRAVLEEKKPGGVVFSVSLGRYVPARPGDRSSRDDSEWRLNEVTTTTATFLDWKTNQNVTLEFESAAGGSLPTGGSSGGGLPEAPDRVLSKETPLQAVLVGDEERVLDDGTVVQDVTWQVADEEVQWFESFSDDEVGSIATVDSVDAQGNPTGFTIKSLPSDGRAAQYGMKAEDKVIAVNQVPVRSKEHAIEVGKSQYDGGTSSFTVQVDRGGRVMNFHFKAPKPKKRKRDRQP